MTKQFQVILYIDGIIFEIIFIFTVAKNHASNFANITFDKGGPRFPIAHALSSKSFFKVTPLIWAIEGQNNKSYRGVGPSKKEEKFPLFKKFSN